MFDLYKNVYFGYVCSAITGDRASVGLSNLWLLVLQQRNQQVG